MDPDEHPQVLAGSYGRLRRIDIQIEAILTTSGGRESSEIGILGASAASPGRIPSFGPGLGGLWRTPAQLADESAAYGMPR